MILMKVMMIDDNSDNYRVSLKKRYFSGFRLISVLEVGFNFFTCVLELEFSARFIQPLKLYSVRICIAIETNKLETSKDAL